MAERSKAWVWSRSPAGIAGSNSAGGMDVCVMCCTDRKKAQPGQSGQRSSIDEVERTKKYPAGGMDVCCECCVCCQVEVSATG